jgi:hypothetical protein
MNNSYRLAIRGSRKNIPSKTEVFIGVIRVSPGMALQRCG